MQAFMEAGISLMASLGIKDDVQYFVGFCLLVAGIGYAIRQLSK